MTHTLWGLLPKALEVLQCELAGEHPLPAAVHVLKAWGLYGIVSPLGPTEVETRCLPRKERQGEQRHRAVFAAEMTLKYCEGSLLLAELIFGWGHWRCLTGRPDPRG
jgi:hypothetical protein